jgi:hypothetical protein
MRNLHIEEAGTAAGKKPSLFCYIYIYIVLTYESTIIKNKNFPYL